MSDLSRPCLAALDRQRQAVDEAHDAVFRARLVLRTLGGGNYRVEAIPEEDNRE